VKAKGIQRPALDQRLVEDGDVEHIVGRNHRSDVDRAQIRELVVHKSLVRLELLGMGGELIGEALNWLWSEDVRIIVELRRRSSVTITR
jgi:hypothetical protein